MPIIKISRRSLAALPEVAKPTVYYDADLKGFGIKVLPSGARSWIVEYRPGAGGRAVAKKRIVIGSPSKLTPEQARDAATKVLAHSELGRDIGHERSQRRADISVSDLCDRYLEEGVALKKASTLVADRGRIARHIKPLIGRRLVGDVSSVDVEKLLRDIAAGKSATVIKTGKRGKAVVRGGKGTATRTIRLLGGIFSWAVRQGLREDNPVRGVETFPDKKSGRFLTLAEIERLGEAIREAETIGVPRKPSTSKHAPKQPRILRNTIDLHAAAAIRLYLLTGCRRGEILNLQWTDVDLERGLLFLGDSKTGRKTIVLNGPAIELLSSLPRIGRHVIASANEDRPRYDIKRPWALVSERAGLKGLRLHDLRHSFASVGAGGGMGLPIIGALLGHTQTSTTARYAHLDADPLRRVSNAIGGRIAEAMDGKMSSKETRDGQE